MLPGLRSLLPAVLAGLVVRRDGPLSEWPATLPRCHSPQNSRAVAGLGTRAGPAANTLHSPLHCSTARHTVPANLTTPSPPASPPQPPARPPARPGLPARLPAGNVLNGNDCRMCLPSPPPARHSRQGGRGGGGGRATSDTRRLSYITGAMQSHPPAGQTAGLARVSRPAQTGSDSQEIIIQQHHQGWPGDRVVAGQLWLQHSAVIVRGSWRTAV